MKQYYILLITLITFTFSNAQIVNIPDANFKNALVNDNVADFDGDGTYDGDVDTNDDGEVQISEAEAVLSLDVEFKSIASMDGIQDFVNLEKLHCVVNNITTMDLSSNIKLKHLHCGGNLISSIDLSENLDLVWLDVSNNHFTSIDFSENINLEYLNTATNISNTSLNVSGNILLTQLNCSNNELSLLDVSNNYLLEVLNCRSNSLEKLVLKNGSVFTTLSNLDFSNNTDFSNSPTLKYICVDKDELSNIVGKVLSYGYNNCVVNSYCSFRPGGKFYEIQGQAIIDIDNNGCDVFDFNFPALKLKLSNANGIGFHIPGNLGDYNIPVESGTYTVTPQLENPDYFTISPPSFDIDFPSNISPYIQNFCVNFSAEIDDLEISILPINQARPGFDADYKLVYKNKGTTTLSGNIDVAFDDNLQSFVSAVPALDSQTTGNLAFTYTNLQPFETRTIEFTMNINTPTDPSFPVNGNDVLDYTATINPVAVDETPEDNVFELHQTVVNSYDPNDKTCLEGKTISPSEVGEYVHYLIRFENTGSASAVNIVVKDVIDTAKYDVSTLIPLHGSHSYVTRIRDVNTVEFIFENINLPFDDANNDGYVAFKIKTQQTLVVNDTFENNAEIYFDYNAPIITNIAQTTVAVLGLTDYELDNSIGIHPNPANDIVNIQGKNNLKDITVFDVNGRILNSISIVGTELKTELDITKLTQGVYFVRVLSNKGQSVTKLIKE